MPDLTGRALRLVHRLIGPHPQHPGGEPDPGTPAAMEGGAAVAGVEALMANLVAGPAPETGGGDPCGALAAATGMGLAGLRATAFVSAPDLAAALDPLAQAAAWGVPLVVHLNAPAGGGAGAATAGGHGAVHAAATAGAGTFQLFAANAQEAVDFALIARRAAEEALAPALVAMDPETAHGVEDLLLPSPALLARYLGDPGDTVHPATPAQEMLWGRHRRRVPRRHDPERPLRNGGPLGPEACALAGAGRRAFVEPHLAALLAGAVAAFAEATGRRHGPLSAHRVKGARLVLVAMGAAVETAEAVADHLRDQGVKVGAIGLRALRPFPAAELVTALGDARAVAVLERIDAPTGGDPPLLAAVRSALDRTRDRPRLTSVLYGLGGFPLRAADLAGVARELDASLGKRGRGANAADAADGAGGDTGAGTFAPPVYLGLELPPAATPYPKRQALLDALRRSYPEAARLGFRALGPAPKLLPEGATTLAVHRRAGEGGETLSGDAARLLHRLAGGHLRGRRDLATAWGTPCVDRVVYAPGAVRDPGDDVAADVAVWYRPAPPAPPDAATLLAGLAPGGALIVETPGDRAEDLEAWWIALPAALRAAAGRLRLFVVPAAAAPTAPPAGAEPPALRDERLLGALLGVVASAQSAGPLAVTPRKLRQARRDLLAEEGAPEVAGAPSIDRRLDAFQAGFDRVQPIDPARFAALPARAFAPAGAAEAAGDDEVAIPAAARRRVKADDALDNLPAFWDRTGILYRHRETAELAPDPYLAVGAVPPLTAALRDHSGARTMLPAFDPAKCTGCGACWTACPDAALAPVATAVGALLDFGMVRARERGLAADALRMVAGKLAAGVDEELAARAGGPAGPLFDAALARLLARSPLPAERKAAVREAWAAVREEIAALPVAKTEVWGDALFSLAVSPDACKGCGLCVAACEPEALTASADTPTRSRAARALWQLADGLPAPPTEALDRARTHPDAGPLAAALATAEARRVMTGGHGAEAGSGEAIALRQVLGAAAALREPERARLLAELTELESKLSAAIHDGLAGALPGADLAALARGLDAVDRPDTDLAGLAARIETAFDGGRVDIVRLRRLVAAARALADLRWRLESGEGGTGRAPFAVAFGAGPAAAWAGAFPDNPFAVPVTVDATADPAALTRGLLAGQLAAAVEGIRALRRARIELDKPAEAERRVEALAGLGWRDLTAEERRLCPPLFLVLSEEATAGAALGGLLDLLAGELPVKVVTLAGAGLEPGFTRSSPRADLGLLALSLPALTVTQTSIAHPAHFMAGLTAALAADAPALLRVLAPSPRRHGFAADRTLARAREAVDAGAFELFVRAGGAAPAAEAAAAPAAPATPADTAAHQAELAALHADYDARLAALAGEIRRDTAQRVRARLLALATRPAAAPPAEEAQP